MYGQFAIQHGATGIGNNNIAIFPDVSTGYNAEDALVSSYANQGATLQSMLAVWSNGDQNEVNFVANQLGVSTSTPVSNLTPSNLTSGPGSTWLSGIGNYGTAIAGLPSQISNWFAGFSWSRVGSFALALIIIIGGIILLQQKSIGVLRKALP